MILYFADRKMNILGQASTELKGKEIINDMLTEDVDSNISKFSCDILYDKSNRLDVRNMTNVGNFILSYNGGKKNEDGILSGNSNFFTIIDSEEGAASQSAHIYAEDAGLDLINDLAPAFSNSTPLTAAEYIRYFVSGKGFTIRNNELTGIDKILSWDSTSTVTARINEICSAFGCEVAYGFDIKGLEVVSKWIDIYKERGTDNGEVLAINRELSDIRVKKSIINLATAIYPTGSNNLTLDNYPGGYDDGDIYISGGYLLSRSALKKWARYPWEEDFTGHIYRTFSCDAETQDDLLRKSIAELKKVREPEINYEVDIADIPFDVAVGDRINIVDDAGEIYVSGRALKIETSVSSDSKVLTLGEYLIKNSGISDKVQQLADEFSKIAKDRQFYIWIAYSDINNPTSVSDVYLESGEHKYVGILPNQASELDDISKLTPEKLTHFKWSKMGGDSPISISINSEDGLIFKNTIRTSLTAVVNVGLTKISNMNDLHEYFGDDATITWYKNDVYYDTGFTLINVTGNAKMDFRCELTV